MRLQRNPPGTSTTAQCPPSWPPSATAKGAFRLESLPSYACWLHPGGTAPTSPSSNDGLRSTFSPAAADPHIDAAAISRTQRVQPMSVSFVPPGIETATPSQNRILPLSIVTLLPGDLIKSLEPRSAFHYHASLK